MTPQELKNSILQLAIQGKLVEHRPEEGTAEELYREIQEEKRRLVKEGTIKKEKPLPEITEDEVPFEIPENWKWVRVGDCLSNHAGLAYKKENLMRKTSNMVRVLRGGNISEMYYALNPDDVIISAEFVKPELLLKKNTIITPAVTSLDHIGKMARIDIDYSDTVVGGFVLMLIPYYSQDIFSKFLLFVFSSQYFRDCCRNIVNKSGQAFYNLSRSKLMQLIIPLPPLAEQKRIVVKIEELLPYIDRYGQAWNRLEAFNKRFPMDMQKSILQLAIQGRLVEHRPEEGTAEELYQQIQAEKRRLIKEGKIKKEKPLPEITEDEMPFEIPESWKWVYFADLLDVRDGTHDTPKYTSTGIPLVTSKNLIEGTIDYSTAKLISPEDARLINMRSFVENGDILFAMIGTIGNPVLVNKDREFCIKNMALLKPLDPNKINMRYFLFFLQNEQYAMKKKASGGVQAFISLRFLRNYPFPLPPLGEQKRIVAKLEELLPLCERLK